LYRDIERLPDVPRYDLMLSPQFYVSKRENLAVKYPFQAKKLAPSILEEVVGEGAFSYEVFREGDDWVFVAYDLEALSDFLASKGGSIDRVRRIYFAEQAKEKFDPPVDLNDREALALINDTVTVVPKSLMTQTEHFAVFDEGFRPEKSFDIKRTHRSVLDTRLSVTLAAVIAALGVVYIVEGYRYQRALDHADDALAALAQAHPSLQGAYARESIHKKYAALDTEQRAIRDRIKAIAFLTGKETRIEHLSVDSKGYEVRLSLPKKPRVTASIKKLSKAHGFAGVTLTDEAYTAKGALQ
jgi:hypothetical protein